MRFQALMPDVRGEDISLRMSDTDCLRYYIGWVLPRSIACSACQSMLQSSKPNTLFAYTYSKLTG